MGLELNKPTKGMLDWDVPMNENIDRLKEYADANDEKMKTFLTAAPVTSVNNKTGAVSLTASDVGASASSHTHSQYLTAAPVTSVNTKTGAVTLTASDVGAAESAHTHTAQTTVTGNAGTATKLAATKTIDGVSFDGSANISHYGVCSIATATAAKTVAITGFTLATGARATVKFTNGNTAAAPTLNINSTGAKEMHYRGVKITNATPTLQTNCTYEFVYNGTEYEILGNIAVGYGY